MFASLARAIARHPVATIVAWALAAAGMLAVSLVGVGDGNLFDRTASGVPTVDGADSTFVLEKRQELAPTDVGPTLTIELTGVDPAAAPLREAVSSFAATIATRAGVVSVAHPYAFVPGPAFNPASAPASTGGDNPLIGADGHSLLINVAYTPFAADGAAVAEHEQVIVVAERALSTIGGVATPVRHFSNPLLFAEFNHQIERDLIVGEAIAIPVALFVMILVFGGFLAASAPTIGALASISGGLAVLFGFSHILDLDQSSINVVTVLGIGLSIDYGLLMVSRYREELARRGKNRMSALEATLSTAGRTVFFSALTVAISVGGMLLFSADIIRGIGSAALGVVVMALMTALTLVPAVMYQYGHRLAALSVLGRVPGLRVILGRTADVSSEEGFFSRLAASTQRRPWIVIVAVTGVLAVFATPLAHLSVRNSEVELLPASNEYRQFLNGFDQRYPALAEPQIDVLADASPAELEAWLTGVVTLDGVSHVGESTNLGGFASAGVFTEHADQASDQATSLLHDIRAVEADFPIYVGGQAAIQVDFVEALQDGAVWAAGLVVLATFVLLFLMTGSLLVPVKTLVINGASLSATLGVVQWIFGDGHLERLLGFTSTGGVETYVLVMIVAFGFGLAMDYEVFLLARIKELVDRGVPNDRAVRLGLQRSGRIITSAALIIILVFAGFAFGQILVIKQVGIGLAFAVLLDATLVRMLLVPATMTLLGDWNWWAPAPLRRLYDRRGIAH